MLNVVFSNRFTKDLKRAAKRGYRIELLEKVVDHLAAKEPLDEKHRDHALKGKYEGYNECHITSDWLLIYQIVGDDLYLLLSRTGTHSDLF